jgi:hypothetical protein
MNLTIEIPDDAAAALKAQAEAEGLSPALYASRVIVRYTSTSHVIGKTVAPVVAQDSPVKPRETGYGMLAKYGPAPSAEEIDENRREMFRNFGRDV